MYKNETWFLDQLFQGVKELFVPAFNNTDTDNWVSRNRYRKYFLLRLEINNYNVLIDDRNFYDQPINDPIKKHDKITKFVTRPGEDYMKGCLLDYSYFKYNYQLVLILASKKRLLLIQ